MQLAEDATPKTVEQREFEEAYITSSEICAELDVARSVLMNARQRGMLPGAIQIPPGNLYIWKREAVAPFLEAWRHSLKVRRGAA